MTKTILLMDDTSTPMGHMANGATWKLEKHGFKCEFDNGRDPQTGFLFDTEVKMADHLIEVAGNVGADGLVLDICWGAHHWGAFEFFDLARERLSERIERNFVVFVTQHRNPAQLREHASFERFFADQVHYKNAEANDAIVNWFCKQFGPDCPCRAKRNA